MLGWRNILRSGESISLTLDTEAEDEVLSQIQASSTQYQYATGLNNGKKAC